MDIKDLWNTKYHTDELKVFLMIGEDLKKIIKISKKDKINIIYDNINESSLINFNHDTVIEYFDREGVILNIQEMNNRLYLSFVKKEQKNDFL